MLKSASEYFFRILLESRSSRELCAAGLALNNVRIEEVKRGYKSSLVVKFIARRNGNALDSHRLSSGLNILLRYILLLWEGKLADAKSVLNMVLRHCFVLRSVICTSRHLL